jgi:hypothetical protein
MRGRWFVNIPFHRQFCVLKRYEGIVTLETDISSCPPSKNVHSPSREGRLTSDHVHRSSKPLHRRQKRKADAESAVRKDRTPEAESNDGEEEREENWCEPVTELATTEKRKYQQSYQAGNSATPFTQVFTKAQQLYSSVRHSYSQSSPEPEAHQPSIANGLIQTIPQALEFDPYSLYTSTSSSANPPIHISTSPINQPPVVHSSGDFCTGTPQQRRRALLSNEVGVFRTAPMRVNSMTPFMEPTLTTRTLSPTGVSQVSDNCPCCRIDTYIIGIQQISSPQGLSSLYPSVVAPWMVGGSTNHPAVPASTSPSCVVVQPIQNAVPKALPQPEVHEWRKINRAFATAASTLKSASRAALRIVTPSSMFPHFMNDLKIRADVNSQWSTRLRSA